MTRLKQELLANGLQIVFTDETNRYFGDYHRVCVVATIICDLHTLPAETPDDELFRRQSIAALGDRLSVVKRIERMGVPSAEVETVCSALIDDFLRNTVVYLARPEYPRMFVNAELKKHKTHRYYG